MKHILPLILGAALLLPSCRFNPIHETAFGNPIIPVRMQSDTQVISMTDYFPLLSAHSMLPQQQTLIDLGYIYDIVECNNADTVCVPVLPHKPVVQGLVTAIEGEEEESLVAVRLRFVVPVENEHLAAYVQNMRIPDRLVTKQEDGTWLVKIEPRLRGRSILRVYAADDQHLFNDVWIPLDNGHPIQETKRLNRHDDQAQVLYSVLIDRFVNGNPKNDWKIDSAEVLDIVNYQGGDLAGITQKIDEGYFDDLGINTLWISPITQNPWDAWGKYVFKNGNKYDSTYTYTKFSGYHGYWPIYATELDVRFGTGSELRELLRTAHRHNINVVLDYVANHMHINSPTLQMHPDWHTDSILPDGRRNFELWDDARLTTWFDSHIPTLDLERQEVCEAMTDSALFWLDKFDFDGFRHDACKHIPELYWRTMGQKLAVRFRDRHIWMIGETYGSPQLINQYVKSGMLQSQFDFNVYFTAIHALCNDWNTMADVDRTIRESLATYGAHHTMGNISGNHDQVRFASFAGGAIRFDEDPKEEGWTREVGLLREMPADSNDVRIEEAYKRALLLEVLNLTIPGVPCIYQGDEYAEVGGGDPDNRHMMRFGSQLSKHEAKFRKKVADLIKMRRSSMPLLYGEYIPLNVTDDVLEFERVYMGNKVRVMIDRKNLTYKIDQ